MIITSETPVREIVIAFPSTIPVLEQLGIDYCCGGRHTLADACTVRNLGVAPVLKELEQRQQPPIASEVQWQRAPLHELSAYIVETHHAFSRKQLGLLWDLAEKVERRHGRHHPELFEVSKAIASIGTELTRHFACEEDVLFPYIARLEAGKVPKLPPIFVSVDQPVARMTMDHDHTGDELRLVREITNNYQPPAGACTTYRALYRALEDLERDLHQHIHLENNILFPRALEQAGLRA